MACSVIRCQADMSLHGAQDEAIRAEVFAMPDTPGQIPAIFAIAPADDGNSSDCECIAVTHTRKGAGRAIELG